MYINREVSEKEFLFQEPEVFKHGCTQNSHWEEMRYEAKEAEKNPIMWDLVCHANVV